MKNNRHFTDALFEEFDYFNDKVDNILTEDLDTMLKYYNNLQNWNKQELLKFLTKDPTWNSNKEQGQYSKWILDKLNRNLLTSSHLGHLSDVLRRFEDNKKYLKNKDINKFKSVQEIDTYLNDDNNYNELSHSQIVRQHRRDKQNVDLDNEAELIYEDYDWEIWIPKTYAASCKLGQGSKWCTASTESSHYFDSYSKKGPLYIILNKNNKKEKYQFHTESNSYMDINDEPINLFDLSERKNNEKWINALRQYDGYFDDRCEEVINEAQKAREEANNFVQKIKSLDVIKYPTQKDITKDYRKFFIDITRYRVLTDEEFDKIKKIKLEIENNVEEIEPHALRYVDLINQVIFEKNSKLRSIGVEAFRNCNNLIELDLPDSITEIGVGAFCSCEKLRSIKLPNNLSNINRAVFSGCRSLKTIIIPKNVKTIGSYAFNNCINLTSIDIPNSVTSIGDGAFLNCISLENIYYKGTIEDWCKILFSSSSSNPMYYAEHIYMLDENNKYYELTEMEKNRLVRNN